MAWRNESELSTPDDPCMKRMDCSLTQWVIVFSEKFATVERRFEQRGTDAVSQYLFSGG